MIDKILITCFFLIVVFWLSLVFVHGTKFKLALKILAYALLVDFIIIILAVIFKIWSY